MFESNFKEINDQEKNFFLKYLRLWDYILDRYK